MTKSMRDRPLFGRIQSRAAGRHVARMVGALAALALAGIAALTFANTEEAPAAGTYVAAPPAPEKQTRADARRKSEGCLTCHTASDNPSMHKNPAIILGCTDCHGGDVAKTKPPNAAPTDPAYVALRAHDGAPVPVRLTTSLLRNERRNIYGAIATFVDLTPIRRASTSGRDAR
jgi:hypothetical protein